MDGSQSRRQEAFEWLRRCAAQGNCGGWLARLAPPARLEILTQLAFERLSRKIADVERIYRASQENWNQTFYLMLFRYMGDTDNRDAYTELAHRVPYDTVLHEKQPGRTVRIEAMLFGCAGLLEGMKEDDYVLTLRSEFRYLQHKYRMEPLDASIWRSSRIRPQNRITLRLSQLASFLTQHDFVVSRVMECRNPKDAERLFTIEASQYWSSHQSAHQASGLRPVRVGLFKSNIIAVNLVCVLQYAYGIYTGNDALCRQAVELLESLPAEQNRFIRRWQEWGVDPQSAFETQALLQLSTGYCAASRCAECPVGLRIVERMLDTL